jgi:hypothetical protein
MSEDNVFPADLSAPQVCACLQSAPWVAWRCGYVGLALRRTAANSGPHLPGGGADCLFQRSTGRNFPGFCPIALGSPVRQNSALSLHFGLAFWSPTTR